MRTSLGCLPHRAGQTGCSVPSWQPRQAWGLEQDGADSWKVEQKASLDVIQMGWRSGWLDSRRESGVMKMLLAAVVFCSF